MMRYIPQAKVTPEQDREWKELYTTLPPQLRVDDVFTWDAKSWRVDEIVEDDREEVVAFLVRVTEEGGADADV